MAASWEGKASREQNSWRSWCLRQSSMQDCSRSEWAPSISSPPPHGWPERNEWPKGTYGDDSLTHGTPRHNAASWSRSYGGATSQRRNWTCAALRFSTCSETGLRTRWQAGRQTEWRSSRARPMLSKRQMVWSVRSDCAPLRQT